MRRLFPLLALALPLAAAPVPKVAKSQLLVVMPYSAPGVPRPGPNVPEPEDPDAERATGKLRLVLVNDDGSDPEPLTDWKTNADNPAWSPDGKKVAFSSDRQEGGWQVFVMDADGTNVKQLTAEKRRSFAQEPRWTADGKRVVYHRRTDAGRVEVVEMDADDGGNQRTTDVMSGPTPSPDGKRMAYYLEMPPPGGVRQLGRVPMRLCVSDADGRNGVWVSAGEDPAFGSPAWSPDGKTLVFGDSANPKKPQELYSVDADGENLKPITDFGGTCQHPAFSADGKRLAYVRSKADTKAEFVVADADGKNPKAIIRGVKPHLIGCPAWKPK